MPFESPAHIRLAVLKTIRRDGPISRVELASTNGLAGATITQITGDLLRRGLVAEEKLAGTGKGRPRTLLSIAPGAATVLGASLDDEGGLEISVVDLGGTLLVRSTGRLAHHQTVEALTRAIAAELKLFIASQAGSFDVSSVALSLPATIENPAGIVHWIPTLATGSTPVRAILTEALDLPVTIENDIDCMARAEHWFGDELMAADFTIVQVGMTMGAADYVGGLPRVGVNGFNAEFAHVKTAWGEEARPCFCGGRGCLAAYASSGGMLRSSGRTPEGEAMSPSELSARFADLCAAALAGDYRALSAFWLAGTHLGVALANLINARDPGFVAIRCTDRETPDLITQPLMAALDDCCLPTIRARTRIVIGAASNDWRWKGTAALALEQAYLGESSRNG